MAKKLTFRGKTIEELKVMPLTEFAKLVDSAKRRSLNRMGKKVKIFLEVLKKARVKGKKIIKTHVREMPIIPDMLDFEFLVYNGKDWTKVVPNMKMLGHRLGEYSITTKLVKHSGPGIGATRGSKSVELK